MDFEYEHKGDENQAKYPILNFSRRYLAFTQG